MEPFKTEMSFRKGKICSFLEDLIELCSIHNVSIETTSGDTTIKFYNWDTFRSLEVDLEGASLYWPRIQTDIIVRRKNEQWKSKEDS